MHVCGMTDLHVIRDALCQSACESRHMHEFISASGKMYCTRKTPYIRQPCFVIIENLEPVLFGFAGRFDLFPNKALSFIFLRF